MLLPLLDTSAVAVAECAFVVEKVGGIVAVVAGLARKRYHTCAPYLKRILSILLELAEGLRQCQGDGAYTFHVARQSHSHSLTNGRMIACV